MPLVFDIHIVIEVVEYGQLVYLRHEVHELVEVVQGLAVIDSGLDMRQVPFGKERKLHREDVQLVELGVLIEHLGAAERQPIVVGDIGLLVVRVDEPVATQPGLDLIGIHRQVHPGIAKLSLAVVAPVAHADVEAVAEIVICHTDQLHRTDGG